MINKTITKKYEIEKDFKTREKLRIFFLIIRPRNIPRIEHERVIGVIAYRHDEALEKIRKDYLEKNPSFESLLHEKDYIYVEDVLKVINVEGITIINVPEVLKDVKPDQIIPTIGFEAFKSGLLFAVDKYLKEKKDKEQMRKLIKKCKEK